MKITITIESQGDSWFWPYSSPEAYFRYNKRSQEREEAREEKIDWISAALRVHQESPTRPSPVPLRESVDV